MDSGHEFPISRVAKVERRSPICGEVIVHVLACSSVLPIRSGLSVCSAKLPCFDSLGTEDVSVDLTKRIPLVVGPFDVEGVCWAAMIEVRNGFCNWNVSVGSSLSSSIRLIELSLVSDSSGHCLNWTGGIQFLLVVGKGM